MTASTSGAKITALLDNKVLAWTMLALWMIVIFAFSNQAHSGEITEEYFHNHNVLVRKMAHMFEYCMLFVFANHALRLTFERTKNFIAASAIIFCVFYALTDEWHQMYVPGRSATINDVLVDSSGSLIGLLVVRYLVLLKSFWSSTRN